MGLQKRTWLLVLFLLALVGAIAVQIIQISQTEKSYPMSMLQKGYETKTENLYPINFSGKGYGYVNHAAQLVVEPQFDEVGKFSEGFAPVKVKDKWGVKALTLDELGNDEEALIAWGKNIKLDPSDSSKWRSQMKESTLERLRSLNKL